MIDAAMHMTTRREDEYLVMPMLFSSWARVDAPAALAFAKELPKGRQQDMAMYGARAWIANSELPEETKKQLLSAQQ